ncbi:MAG: GIY-YIG nuclease family protein [Clostridiales bacterium]|nr:GIY-YIG nuclease family protein [Clostridiales bacterium]
MPYFVYILSCSDGTLYTGITNDPEARLAAHNSGKGAKYTSGRRPVRIVYQKLCESKSEALRCEIKIKKMTRKRKLQWIAANTVAGNAILPETGLSSGKSLSSGPAV